MSIIVTAGHNKSDPGASANGYVEAFETIILRDLVCIELAKRGINAKKDNDEWSLIDTIKNIFTTDKDVCLDIHWNCGPEGAGGTEAYISDNHTEDEKKLAMKLVDNVSSVLNIKKRVGSVALGVKTESESARKRLGILRQENGINVLLEVCFLSNKSEMDSYHSHKGTLAQLIATSLELFYKK